MEFVNWFWHPLKNQYADFTGRATRQAFWMYTLVYLIIAALLSAVGIESLSFLFALAVFLPSVAITARRLHDIGKSGWWQLLFLIPVIGLIVMIVFLIREGDEQENAYGPNPAEPTPVLSAEEQPQTTESTSTEPPITPTQ
jgi:uncharacterized membrane protein YhaH (DUF805 family)